MYIIGAVFSVNTCSIPRLTFLIRSGRNRALSERRISIRTRVNLVSSVRSRRAVSVVALLLMGYANTMKQLKSQHGLIPFKGIFYI
jgi:hypothetical protein